MKIFFVDESKMRTVAVESSTKARDLVKLLAEKEELPPDQYDRFKLFLQKQGEGGTSFQAVLCLAYSLFQSCRVSLSPTYLCNVASQTLGFCCRSLFFGTREARVSHCVPDTIYATCWERVFCVWECMRVSWLCLYIHAIVVNTVDMEYAVDGDGLAVPDDFPPHGGLNSLFPGVWGAERCLDDAEEPLSIMVWETSGADQNVLDHQSPEAWGKVKNAWETTQQARFVFKYRIFLQETLPENENFIKLLYDQVCF